VLLVGPGDPARAIPPLRGCARATQPELLPVACDVTEQYTNNPIEADHGRLKP
jgi:hypothetical protein